MKYTEVKARIVKIKKHKILGDGARIIHATARSIDSNKEYDLIWIEPWRISEQLEERDFGEKTSMEVFDEAWEKIKLNSIVHFFCSDYTNTNYMKVWEDDSVQFLEQKENVILN